MVGKKIIILDEEELRLVVKVIGTFGVTDGCPYQYKVQAWTNSNERYETKDVATEGDPEFNEELAILQNRDLPAEYLFVDLFKTNSAGTCFVGRGMAPLPTAKNINVYTEVDLFGNEKTGCLQLSFVLMDFEILGYASS